MIQNAKRICIVLIFALSSLLLPASSASAACYQFYGCATYASSLNLSTAKPYYLNDTKTAQYHLWNDGWSPGPQDGYFGSQTRSAVLTFQRHYGLAVDGIVGRQTWDCLQLCPQGLRFTYRA